MNQKSMQYLVFCLIVYFYSSTRLYIINHLYNDAYLNFSMISRIWFLLFSISYLPENVHYMITNLSRWKQAIDPTLTLPVSKHVCEKSNLYKIMDSFFLFPVVFFN